LFRSGEPQGGAKFNNKNSEAMMSKLLKDKKASRITTNLKGKQTNITMSEKLGKIVLIT
jgi:hypothetical protein